MIHQKINKYFIIQILNRQPPFGHQLYEALLQFPKYSLKLNFDNKSTLSITVSQLNRNVDWETFSGKVSVIVGDSENNLLFFRDNM